MHKRSRLGPGLPRNYKNLLHCNYYPYQTISCKLLHKQFQFVTIKDFAQKKKKYLLNHSRSLRCYKNHRGFAGGPHKGSLQDFSGPPAATDNVLTLTGLTTLLQQSLAHCATLCNTSVSATL